MKEAIVRRLLSRFGWWLVRRTGQSRTVDTAQVVDGEITAERVLRGIVRAEQLRGRP